MMKWACTKQLSVGNRAIDSAHKELFGTIDRIARSIAEKNISALAEAFDLLENCLCAYSAAEENIAQAVGFDFTEHRLTHQDLLNEFQRIKNWLAEKNGTWSEFEGKGCVDSLKNRMVRHIEEEGKQLKIILATHYYDFNP